MGKKGIVLLLICSLFFILCGCDDKDKTKKGLTHGEKKEIISEDAPTQEEKNEIISEDTPTQEEKNEIISEDAPTQGELKTMIEENVLNYSIEGQAYKADLKNFEVVKGQKTSEGHYDVYCEITLTGKYIDVTLYYVLNCAYYDITGWEIESASEYEESDICVNELPMEQVSYYTDQYMTFVSDQTTYDNENICCMYDYYKSTEYYTETGNYGVEGYIYCSNSDLFCREYSWFLKKVKNNREVIFNNEKLSGIWMAEGLGEKTYYVTISSVEGDTVEWSIERTIEEEFYNEDPYLIHEYNSGSSTITEEDNIFSYEISFPVNVGSEYFYDDVSGSTFTHTDEELVCHFNLDKIENSYITYANQILFNGYKLLKISD